MVQNPNLEILEEANWTETLAISPNFQTLFNDSSTDRLCLADDSIKIFLMDSVRGAASTNDQLRVF